MDQGSAAARSALSFMSVLTDRDGSLRRLGFTVIELLVVIGVLSLLLSIVIPTIKTVRAAALRNRAAVEANVLAQAAIHYKNVYGFWPGQLKPKSDTDSSLELRTGFKNQTGFISFIVSAPAGFTDQLTFSAEANTVIFNLNEVYQSFCRVGRRTGEKSLPNPLNPKGIHFLDLVHEDDPSQATFLDPWGNAYALLTGMNEKSSFTLKNKSTGAVITHLEGQCAYAISGGPDGFSESNTNYIYSAGVKP